MPSIVFSFKRDIETLAETLVNDSLLPLFRQLHPENSGWDLSLVNLCATNMAQSGTNSKDGVGRDIGHMFRRQDDVLRGWKVEDRDTAPSDVPQNFMSHEKGFPGESKLQKQTDTQDDPCWDDSRDAYQKTQDSSAADDGWDSGTETAQFGEACVVCGAIMPVFAMAAHQRFHTLPD